MNNLAESAPNASATILIVEDHDIVRANLYDWLSAIFADYCFLMVKSGEDALELTIAQQPEIVLMDIELPGINGIEATRRIKAIASGTQVVILSIHEDHHYRMEAAAAGAGAYVSKRRMSFELLTVMRRLLSRPIGTGSVASKT